MLQLKAFIIRFFFLFLIRFIIYGLALLPFCYAVSIPMAPMQKTGLLVLTLLAAPLLVILLVGLFCYCVPPTKTGAYALFSPPFTKWFLRDTVIDMVASSSLLSNLVVRIDFLKMIFYRLLGMKNPQNMILAPKVQVFDPDKFSFGENVFIGFGSLISGHFIKKGKLMLDYSSIGSGVTVGAYCKIAYAVKIGANTRLGFGVEVGSNCTIGRNVVISDGVTIDDNTIIHDNATIGKKCILGRKSVIGAGSYIGSYSTLGSKVVVEPGIKVPELSVLKYEYA